MPCGARDLYHIAFRTAKYIAFIEDKNIAFAKGKYIVKFQ